MKAIALWAGRKIGFEAVNPFQGRHQKWKLPTPKCDVAEVGHRRQKRHGAVELLAAILCHALPWEWSFKNVPEGRHVT